MSPDEFQQVLEVRPFVPVRVHLLNGRTHDILDAATARVGQEAVVVGVYDQGTKFPRWRLLSLININEVEPLTPAQLG